MTSVLSNTYDTRVIMYYAIHVEVEKCIFFLQNMIISRTQSESVVEICLKTPLVERKLILWPINTALIYVSSDCEKNHFLPSCKTCTGGLDFPLYKESPPTTLYDLKQHDAAIKF